MKTVVAFFSVALLVPVYLPAHAQGMRDDEQKGSGMANDGMHKPKQEARKAKKDAMAGERMDRDKMDERHLEKDVMEQGAMGNGMAKDAMPKEGN